MASDNPDGTGTWRVMAIGSNLTRSVPTSYTSNLPAGSQFTNKMSQHEQVHVNQFIQGQGHLFGDLFLVSSFYVSIRDITGTSFQDLVAKIDQQRADFKSFETDRAQALRNQAEYEAHAVSDPISPQYAYQNCGRFTP